MSVPRVRGIVVCCDTDRQGITPLKSSLISSPLDTSCSSLATVQGGIVHACSSGFFCECWQFCVSVSCVFSCDPVDVSCFSCDLVVTLFLSYLCVCGFRALLVVEVFRNESRWGKPSKACHSKNCCARIWKHHAENQRGRSEMSMLDEVAAEAVALAEMQIQVGDLPTAVDSMVAETIKKGGDEWWKGRGWGTTAAGRSLCKHILWR